METEERMAGKEEAKPSTCKQVVATFCVYAFSLSLGASNGFSGVAIPQLQKSIEDGGIGLNDDQLSWFASLPILAGIPMSLVGGMLAHHLGSRLSLQLIAPLFATGFMCQAAASEAILLQFGRLVCGAAGGLACGPTATYVTEVTTPALRTTLNAGISGAYNLGMVLVFTLGAFCNWRILAGVSAALPLTGLFLLCAIPESPTWYVTSDRLSEARDALRWLRGRDFDVEQELAILNRSYEDAKRRKSENREKASGLLGILVTFRRPDVYKPLLLFLGVTLLQQFSGMASISYYAVSVLVGAGSSINEYAAAITYSLMRFLSQVGGSFLLIRFRRKHLLIFSSLFVSMGMALMGASAYVNSYQQNNQVFGVLPLVSVVLVAVFYHLGLGPIPWSYTAELFPVDVRPQMSGLANCVISGYIFVSVKTFPAMTEAMTMAGTYWFYASVCLLTIIFTLLFLPETKDKRLDEITDEFTDKEKNPLQPGKDDSKVVQ